MIGPWFLLANGMNSFEINLGIIAACIPFMKPLWRSIRSRIWSQKSTQRLDSDENLAKHDHWYSRWLQTCGKRDHSTSHGANEPSDFGAYVRYTRDWHRRKRPPNAAVEENNPTMPNAVAEERGFTMTEDKPALSQVPSEEGRSTMTDNNSALSRVPSIQSVHLPLHGVRKENNRYSTVDPIVELKGILENKELDRNSDPDLEIGRAL